ncbi:hypothetical protein C8R44DRAFT_758269 [Mycena epipterygia]|nr:hypothetical protein C8R44DRAFT_758269 [Mycena epipterygia]
MSRRLRSPGFGTPDLRIFLRTGPFRRRSGPGEDRCICSYNPFDKRNRIFSEVALVGRRLSLGRYFPPPKQPRHSESPPQRRLVSLSRYFPPPKQPRHEPSPQRRLVSLGRYFPPPKQPRHSEPSPQRPSSRNRCQACSQR